MSLLRAILPHLSLALTAALLVVVILDVYNPLLGFLSGAPFLVLFALTAVAAAATAVALIRHDRRGTEEKGRSEP